MNEEEDKCNLLSAEIKNSPWWKFYFIPSFFGIVLLLDNENSHLYNENVYFTIFFVVFGIKFGLLQYFAFMLGSSYLTLFIKNFLKMYMPTCMKL